MCRAPRPASSLAWFLLLWLSACAASPTRSIRTSSAGDAPAATHSAAESWLATPAERAAQQPLPAEEAKADVVFQSVARNHVVDAVFLPTVSQTDPPLLVTLGGDGEAALVDLRQGSVRGTHRLFARRGLRRLRLGGGELVYGVNATSLATSGGLRSWSLRSGRGQSADSPGLSFVDYATTDIDASTGRIAIVHVVQQTPVLRLQEGARYQDAPLLERATPRFVGSSLVLLRMPRQGRIELRRFEDGEALWERPLHRAATIAIHPAGQAIFTLWDRRLLWLDPSTGAVRGQVPVPDETADVLLISGDGERIAMVGTAGTLVMWATRDGQRISAGPLPAELSDRDVELLLTRSGEGMLSLGSDTVGWAPLPFEADGTPTGPEPTSPEPTSPEPTSPEPTSPEPTSPVPTSPVPTSPEPTSSDISTGRPGAVQLPSPAHELVESGDGKFVAAVGSALFVLPTRALREARSSMDTSRESVLPTRALREASPATGRDEVRRFRAAGGEHNIWGVSWLPDDSGLVTYGRGGVELWSAGRIGDTKCVGTGGVLWGDRPAFLSGSTRCDLTTGETVRDRPAIAVSADRRRLLVDTGPTLEVLDSTGRSTLTVLKPRPATRACEHGACAARSALSPSGDALAWATDETLFVHTGRGRRLARKVLAESEPVVAMALGPGARTLVTFHPLAPAAAHGGPVQQGPIPPAERTARLWRVRDMRLVTETAVSHAALTAFDPSGEHWVGAYGSVVTFIAAREGRTLAEHDLKAPISELRTTSRGDAMIVGSRHRLRVLELDGAPRAVADDIRVPWAVSDDGEKLAQCDSDGELRLRDLLTREETSLGACAEFDQLSFSASARFLAIRSGSRVRVIRLTDKETLLLRTPRVEENLQRLAFPYAVDGRGRYQLADPRHATRFLYRQAGDMRTAPMVPLDEVRPTDGLVERFFAPSEAEVSGSARGGRDTPARR